MDLRRVDPPRAFAAGGRELAHVADVGLAPGELVTFTTPAGAAFDVTRTAFGFYATGSLNGRVAEHGLRGVLCANRQGRVYLLLVERGREAAFERYLGEEGMRAVAWLDSDAAVAEVLGEERAAGGDGAGQRPPDDVGDR